MAFKYWKAYFLRNQSHFSKLDWNSVRPLTDEERQIIASSIQQFQKGESSEGKQLFLFAKSMQDETYMEAITLFIREEQTHAGILSQYMANQNIPRISGHWVDDVFRGLRKMAGLQLTLTVLLTAEIVAKIYYNALKRCTRDPLLAAICEQILRDEDQHIDFQCYAIKKLNEVRSFRQKWVRRYFHALLMRGTLLVVWMEHHKVYRQAGLGFWEYWRQNMEVYSSCSRNIEQSGILSIAF